MIRTIDLQLFSEEKTEQPTPKKLRDAREKGQIPQSKELSSAIALLAVFVGLNVFSGYIINGVFDYFNFIADKIPQVDSFFDFANIHLLINETLMVILKLALPLLLIALVTGVLVTYLQVGFIFTLETIKPKFEKISPLKGFKNMFSLRSLVELIKSVLKLVLILYVAVSYVYNNLDRVLATFELSVGQIIISIWDIVFGIIIRCSILLLVIAIFDFVYKRWKNNKDLMMSKKEIKDEYKQSEGDPQLKAKIKEKQRAFAMGRMMQDVPKADVIITNPTHFAVALKYDSNLGDAPIVTAKGQDLIAQNIKRIAGEADVPIIENKPLARALFHTVDIGEFIPPDLYEAVAEVLAYVYNLKHNQ